jgi:small subunit ribosomal protein S5
LSSSTASQRLSLVDVDSHLPLLSFSAMAMAWLALATEKQMKFRKRLQAKKSFFKVPRIQGTIPHPVQGEDAAGVVLLRPAAPGTGVIAGGPVRAVLECAGITDVLTKSLGSNNPINMVHATAAALKSLEDPRTIAARRGLPLERVAPAAIVRAMSTTAGA